MKGTIAGVLVLILTAGSTGCFRAHYTQLYGRDGQAPIQYSGPAERHSESWQHFFIFGWVPGERTIESGQICGDGGVREIQTRQSFAQGLVTALSSFFINIYAPWTGKTRCR